MQLEYIHATRRPDVRDIPCFSVKYRSVYSDLRYNVNCQYQNYVVVSLLVCFIGKRTFCFSVTRPHLFLPSSHLHDLFNLSSLRHIENYG